MSGEGPENGKEKEEEEAVGGTCYICETGIRDPDLLGDMEQTVLRKPGRKSITINCHYFCLLFSCNLRMNGQEGEGIRGFLAEDIEKERNRGRSLTCYFCHKTGPTSACCEKTCKVAYHLPCALYLPDKLKSLVPEGFIKEVCLVIFYRTCLVSSCDQ